MLSFDDDRFRGLVDMAHWRYVEETGDEFIADPSRVHVRGRAYAKILRAFRLGESGRPLMTYRDVENVAFAGLGVYLIDHYGKLIDRIYHYADKGVVDLIYEVSGNPRECCGVRRRQIQQAVSQASELGQLVRFCEICDTAVSLQDKIDGDAKWLTAKAETGQTNHYELQSWVDHAAELVKAMGGQLLAPGPFTQIRSAVDAALLKLCAASKVRQTRRMERERLRREAAAEEVGGSEIEPSSQVEEADVPTD